MMANVTYRCTGSEQREDGYTVIPAGPSSGLEVTNLFIDGAGVTAYSDEVNMLRGVILISGILPRGSIIQWLYKTLPRYVPPRVYEFEPTEFDSSEFA
jgi:hypothetical protein